MVEWIRHSLGTLPTALVWAPSALAAATTLALAAALALLAHEVLTRILRRVVRRRGAYVQSFLRQARALTRLTFLLLALGLVLPTVPLGAGASTFVVKVLTLATVVLIGWLALIALNISSEIYLRRLRVDVADNLSARKHITQVRFLRRAAATLIIVVTAGAALMTFDAVRQYGVSLSHRRASPASWSASRHVRF